MYKKELCLLNLNAKNIISGRLHLDHPKKERLLLTTNKSALLVRNIIVNDKTTDPNLIEKLKEKIDDSLNILYKGSGRLHNDLTPWNQAANLEMLLEIIKENYKKYKEKTNITHFPVKRFDLNILDKFSENEEINIYDNCYFLDRTQTLAQRTNIKILNGTDGNFLVRINNLTESFDPPEIGESELSQNIYELPNKKIYENIYTINIDNLNTLKTRLPNILNLFSK